MMKYDLRKFKDGQVSARIIENGNLDLSIKGNSYEDLFSAASIKEAWDYENALNKEVNSTLTIFCLIGQRSDRRFNKGESFDLKVIANFINSMNFDRVKILHPHSEITLALINNSERISHFPFVQKAYNSLDTPILISPDAGAYKTTHEIAEKLEASLIPSNKVRVNGVPSISIQGDVAGKSCLIVDDLADGGRTFGLLAKELKENGANKVYLYVTHGQFHYGFDELSTSIDHFFCTDSFRQIDDPRVMQFSVENLQN